MSLFIEGITFGSTNAIIIKGVVHILKKSKSSYGLNIAGVRLQYCCQDGCCDAGLKSDVLFLVEIAKELGATKVVIRVGQRGHYCSHIAGLPVECVSMHVGEIDEGIFVDQLKKW